MTGATNIWRWVFAATAAVTAISFIFQSSREWALHGLWLSAPIRFAATVIYVVLALGVLLRRKWSYVSAGVASCITLFFLSWVYFGYPRHSAPAALALAWMLCLMFQLGPQVRHHFYVETK